MPQSYDHVLAVSESAIIRVRYRGDKMGHLRARAHWVAHRDGDTTRGDVVASVPAHPFDAKETEEDDRAEFVAGHAGTALVSTEAILAIVRVLRVRAPLPVASFSARLSGFTLLARLAFAA